MASAATSDKKLNQMIKGTGASFAPIIIAEAKRARLPLSLALALVDQESGFKTSSAVTWGLGTPPPGATKT